MLRIKKNQSGFSLVELMVVVAIIGILAAVAIPNFTRFQRKARVAEAKDMLSGEFNAEKGFLAEWEGYTDHLILAGYRTEGAIRTNAGFVSAGTFVPQTILTQANASVTAANVVCPAADSVNSGLICTTAACNANVHCTVQGGITLNAVVNSVSTTGLINNISGTASFTLGASTNVGSSRVEEWTLTDGKTLAQVQDGVNTD